ncbi:MAG: ABC transporter permease [Haloferacaceae archaeon]
MTPLGRLYRRFPAVLMARRNLSRNRLRSSLAALGIVIGVLAIASLGMFGTTLRVGADQQLGGFGNEIGVIPNTEAGVTNFTERDVQEIERVVSRGTVVAVKSDSVRVGRGGDETFVRGYGIGEPSALFSASAGRVPDRFRSGVLVGSALAEDLDVEPGNTLTVDGRNYRVQAVLAEEGQISFLNPNGAVVLPPSAFDTDRYSQVIVTADSGAEANETAVAIRNALNSRRERVVVLELSTVTESINQFFGIINAFLVGVGSISLVVAAVSILNVMLMSTVERRQEIGVLRAVGVQRSEVMRTILAEAGLLGVVGGLAGTALALLAGLALNVYILSDPMVTFRPQNLLYLVLAFAFALATSLLSGLYPAWKAAREHPVEALRSG